MKLLKAALVLAILSVPALAGTISISPPTRNVHPGDSISIDIAVSNLSDLYGWQLDIGFNPAVLSVQSVIEGAFLSSGGTTFFIPGSIDNVGGSLTFGADTLETAIAGVTGSGTLATVLFSVTGAGVSPISLLNVQLLDSTLSPISGTVASGTVISTAATPEPSSFFLLVVPGLFMLTLGRPIVRRAIRIHKGESSVWI